jgi:hypothetical protein
MSCKYGVARCLDFYDQIAYVDADILLRPRAVSLFDLASDADWAAVDERPQHHWLDGSHMPRYWQFCERHGFEAAPFYFNCGVQVARKAAQQYMREPDFPLIASHCAEQESINARMWAAHLRGEINILSLDRRANWQNWCDPAFREAPEDAVLHWSGGGIPRRTRAEDIARVATLYPYGEVACSSCLLPSQLGEASIHSQVEEVGSEPVS